MHSPQHLEAESPIGHRSVIFIELNPFASRIDVLIPLLDAASSLGRPTCVMPGRPDGDDLAKLRERFKSDHCTFIQTSVHQVAPGRPSLKSFWVALRTVSRLQRAQSSIVVLSAIDDYIAFLPLAILFPRVWRRFGFVMVQYRVAEELKDQKSFKLNLRALFLRSIRSITDSRRVVFDERLAGRSGIDLVLPDPYKLTVNTEKDSTPNSDPVPGSITVGLIGTQNSRKGFDVAVAAIDLLRSSTHDSKITVLLVGRVEEAMSNSLAALRGFSAIELEHWDYYISDRDLAGIIRRCDVVLLPYDRTFTSTSGVLINAVAMGVPVVASNHGLVGFRVEQWSLGKTFVYPRHDELANILRDTIVNPLVLGDSAKEFVSRSGPAEVSASFRALLGSYG